MWVQVVRCACACTCTCTGGLPAPSQSCTRSKSASSSGPPKFPINRPPPTLACRFRFPLLSLSSSKPPGFPGHFHPPRTGTIITRASDRKTPPPHQLHPAPGPPLHRRQHQHSPFTTKPPLCSPTAAAHSQINCPNRQTTKTTTAKKWRAPRRSRRSSWPRPFLSPCPLLLPSSRSSNPSSPTWLAATCRAESSMLITSSK